MNDSRRKGKKQSVEISKFKKNVYLKIPLSILLILFFFMIFQSIGERFGFLPTIILAGDFFGDEEVILFILNISVSILFGLLLAFYLTRNY